MRLPCRDAHSCLRKGLKTIETIGTIFYKNVRIYDGNYLKQSSSKRANIRGVFIIACLCSPSSRTSCFLAVKPQVTFASLSSPAVMDIRRLRQRLLEIPYHKCESSEIKNIVSIVSIVFKNLASEKL